MKSSQYLVAAFLCSACVFAAHAQGISDFVVYLECAKEGQPTSFGTGVLVSEKGHVLTAKHVVPEGYNCKGVPGNPTLPTRGLIKDPRLMENIDARLLKFVPGEGEKFPSVKFCKLDDKLKGKSIKARGFSQGSNELTVRQGVISTIHTDEKGIIETDVITTRGMSGGPVMLGDGSNLIGIVSGAQFDPATGQPAYFGVLATETIADVFGLAEAPNPCPDQNNDGKPNKVKPEQPATINQKIEGNSGIVIQSGGSVSNTTINNSSK
ncbi:serine protease [Nitrosomonas sp.]|uniref:S1 family peptidase n=1 Tax=Nitrosomonas sp. TaxID=42353 RepID=UPI0032EC724C